MAKKEIMALFLVSLIALMLPLHGCKEKISYEKTLERVAKVDEKYGMGIDDYKYGLDYMRYNPRYPNPINPEEIPSIVDEFAEIRKDASDDRPSFLLLDARIHLLEAEKFYKLSKKYPLKGSVEDGFNCGEMDYIIEAVKDLNFSVYHGRIAMESLGEFQSVYSKEAEAMDISRYWVKSVNETFDELAVKAKKNENTITYFCLNETSGMDEEFEQEFLKANEAYKQGTPQIVS